jgi:acyl-CoA hydrolase
MENKMKKLIALFATTAVASGSAMGAIALSGSASVSYDDKGSAASATTYDADMTVTGTAGATTFTQSMDIDAAVAVTATTLATTVGPLTVTADMFNEDDSTTVTTTGGRKTDSGDNRSVTVSLAAPIGDANLALDDSGDLTISGTWSGVTVSHKMSDGGDVTSGSASLAGMDVSVTNDDGSSTWSIGTTVAGTAVTLNSDSAATATFGVTGNTVVVSHTSDRAAATATNTDTHWNTTAKAAFTTIAVSRDLTSGAVISATYDSFDDALTLKASVAF